MKKIGILLTVMLITSVGLTDMKGYNSGIKFDYSVAFGDGDLVNARLWGGSGSDITRGIVETNDGGWVTAGYTKSNGTGDVPLHGAAVDVNSDWSSLVTKFNPQGDIEWVKPISGNADDKLRDVYQLEDGTYIGFGTTESSAANHITDTNNGSYDVFTVRLDASGNVTSTKLYGGTGNDSLTGTAKTPDGGFIVAGFSTSSQSGDITSISRGSSDGLLMKFDAQGNLVWDKLVGGSWADYLEGLDVAPNGDIYAVGRAKSSSQGDITQTNKGDFDALITKFNSLGELQWVRTYGGALTDWLMSARVLSDGNIIAVGTTTSNTINGELHESHGEQDALIIKLSPDGIPIWTKVFGGAGADYIYDVLELSLDKILLIGRSDSSESGDITATSHGLFDGLILDIDTDGNLNTHSLVGGDKHEYFARMVMLSDGRYIIAGESQSSNNGDIQDTTNGGGDALVLINTFAPEITVPNNVMRVEQGTPFDLWDGVSATDYEDGLLTSSIIMEGDPGQDAAVGEYDITYKVTDSDQNTTTVIVKLLIYIPTPPILTVPSETMINPGEPFDPMAGVSAWDPDGSETGTAIEITSSVTYTGMPADTNTSGTYIITYRVEDAQGNVEVAERKLVITSKPTINFEDNYIVATNDTFDPMAGVTASDRENGDLTTSILVTSNPVDTSSVGSYIVVYEVTDSDGNKTIRERTIIVTGEPVILHPGDTTIAFGSTFDKLEGVTASDPEDGSLTSQIVVGGDDVNTNTVGTYIIFYSVVDSVGSRTTVYRVITVTKVPTFGDMSDVYIKVDDSYDPLEGVTATDPEDGNLTARIVVTSGSIDSSTPGEYVITYSVTDNDGYTVVATRSIFVTEPPVIHAEDTIIEVNSEFDVATYATVTDLEDETLPVSYTFIGTEFDATVPGVYTIEYSAEDSHGFVTTKRITVTVAGSPVISGIDDIRVNPNSIFIPMNGVTATDWFAEDITQNITVVENTVNTAVPGTYYVVYRVADSRGFTTENRRNVIVTNAPTISGLTDVVINIGDAFDPMTGVSASDVEDGDNLIFEVIASTVDPTTSGDYTVQYRVEDSDGNVTILTRNVHVTYPPQVGSMDDLLVLYDDIATLDLMEGIIDFVTDEDSNIGDITIRVSDDSPTTADMANGGTFVVTYVVTDETGNTVKATRTIHVVTYPVINYTDNYVINPNSEFDPLFGVTATEDLTDGLVGDITGSIVVHSNNVSTSTPGNYVVTYKVTDRYGQTTNATRTIIVSEGPIISGVDDVIMTVNGQFDPMAGVSATDKEDGVITSSIEILSNNVDVTTPGIYTVVYSVTDRDGNSTEVSRKVTVKGLPTITIVGNDITINMKDSYDPLAGVTAADPEDGTLTNITVSGKPSDTNTPGTYTLTYTVSDSDGNEATMTRNLIIKGTPTIKLPSNTTIKLGAEFNPLEGVTASDYEDGNITASIKVVENNVKLDEIGEYTIVYSVTDVDGNEFTITRTVKVVDSDFEIHPYVMLIALTFTWIIIMSRFVVQFKKK